MAEAAVDSSARSPRIPFWATVLPIAFIVLALCALVLVPILLSARTRLLWSEIADVAEPADFLVDHIEFALAREIAGIRGYLLTGDPGYLELYARAATEEATAYEPLEELARQLAPDVVERLRRLESLSARWHARADRLADVEMPRAEPERIEAIRVQQALYRETLDAAVALDETIDRAVDRRRQEIRRAERLEALLTGALALLALAAALAVGRLGWRLQRLTERAEARRREVEDLTRRRAEFIRGLGHDLKNPLGAVDSYAQILEAGIKGDLAPEQRHVLERIRRSTHSAIRIIDDLLELSRAEAGQLPIRYEPTDVRAVVYEAAEEHRAELDEAGIELDLDLPAGLPDIQTDPRRIGQILGNLLSNAAKYVPEGGRVTMRAAQRSGRGTPGDRGWLVLEVEDTGPGIPAGEQKKIFQEFHRLAAVEGRQPGTGLGLAISRRIARLLGGDLTLRSQVGVGSTFSLWLPIRPPATRPPSPERP